ncbi:MAG: hypothetical protein FWD52_00540 [Candidatus Bathyarchaeota archaeon]|nr:hypothetical protein [Candidatus Termiticorpusculum sp.]
MVLNRHPPILKDIHNQNNNNSGGGSSNSPQPPLHVEGLKGALQRHKTSPQTSGSSFNNARSKVVVLEQKVDNLNHVAQMQKMLIHGLQTKCTFLEDCLKKDKTLAFKEDSDNNITLLRAFFDLKQTSPIPADSEPLEGLKGLIKDFSDKKTDSVDLIRQVRGG